MQRLAMIIPALVLVACGDDTSSPENVRPVSSFTYSCEELACAFTNTSTDQEGPLVSSIFNFGDGNSTGAADPTHTYAIGGTYTVSLVVQDLDGAKVGSEQTIGINSRPNVTIVTPVLDEAEYDFGTPITFEAIGTDLESDVLAYAWFHEEAGKLTLLSTAIMFTTSDLPLGRQLIQVTATDGGGASASSLVEVVIVTPAAAP